MALDKIVEALSASGRKVKKLGQYAVLGLTLAFSSGYGGCDAEQYCDTTADCGDGQECLEGVCGEGSCEESPFSGKYAWAINNCIKATYEPLPPTCVVNGSYGTVFYNRREDGDPRLYTLSTSDEISEHIGASLVKPISQNDFSTREECHTVATTFHDEESFRTAVQDYLCAVEHPQIFIAALELRGKFYTCPDHLIMIQDTPYVDFCSCLDVVNKIGIMDRCGIYNRDSCE